MSKAEEAAKEHWDKTPAINVTLVENAFLAGVKWAIEQAQNMSVSEGCEECQICDSVVHLEKLEELIK